MTVLNNRILAEVILSSAVSLEIVGGGRRSRNRSEMQTFPKRIVFDFKDDYSYFVVNNKSVVNINTGEKLLNNFDILNEIEKSLTGVREPITDATDLDSNNCIEFIKLDEITRSVIVFSKAYVSKFVNSDVNIIGEMVLDYFRLWYMGKVGKGKRAALNHHEKFKTFSLKETEYIKHQFIPLAIAPNNLNPISKAIASAIEASPLSSYVETDIGYSIAGTRVEGSKMYWVPQIVAREYLEETDNYKVLTETMLTKLMRNSGLLGTPAVSNEPPIANSIVTAEEIKRVTDDFILKSVYDKHENIPESVRPKPTISYDIDEKDNAIPEDAGEINLNY